MLLIANTVTNYLASWTHKSRAARSLQRLQSSVNQGDFRLSECEKVEPNYLWHDNEISVMLHPQDDDFIVIGVFWAEKVKPGSIWQHCKGGIYKVIGVADETEIEDGRSVIYHPLDNPYKLYARPLDSFLGLHSSGKKRFVPH